MARYKLKIEYNGTGYSGWQRQKNVWTIQEALESAIYKFSGERVNVQGAGRTDQGVHAYGQVAHVDFLKEYEKNTILHAINFYLKNEHICILSVERVSESFHARFSAVNRIYHYYILNRQIPSPLYKNLMWHVPYKLNYVRMQKEAKSFEGKHDFSFFRSSGCQAKNAIRTIQSFHISIDNDNGQIIRCSITARSFLYHQVCNMVGALVMISANKVDDSIANLLLMKIRSNTLVPAPPHGLYFVHCDY